MSDIIPTIAIASLLGNAVLLVAYARLHSRCVRSESNAEHLDRHLKAALSDVRSLSDTVRSSVRRDPRTGRYLKQGG